MTRNLLLVFVVAFAFVFSPISSAGASGKFWFCEECPEVFRDVIQKSGYYSSMKAGDPCSSYFSSLVLLKNNPGLLKKLNSCNAASFSSQSDCTGNLDYFLSLDDHATIVAWSQVMVDWSGCVR